MTTANEAVAMWLIARDLAVEQTLRADQSVCPAETLLHVFYAPVFESREQVAQTEGRPRGESMNGVLVKNT